MIYKASKQSFKKEIYMYPNYYLHCTSLAVMVIFVQPCELLIRTKKVSFEVPIWGGGKVGQ